VLPGIPLARIFPLEQVMVEALQTVSTKKKVRLKVKEEIKMKQKNIIKLKIKEEADPGKMGQTKPPATGRDGAASDSSVYNQAGQGTSEGPSGATFRGNLQGVSQKTNVAMGNDPAASKPEGVWTTSITEPENVYPKEGVTGTPLHVKPSDQPTVITSQTPMPEVDSHQGPSKVAAPPTHLDMPEGDTSMHPTAPSTMPEKSPHDCPPGHHWTDDMGCQPDASALATGGVPNPLEQAVEPEDEPCPEGQHRNSEGECVPEEPTSTESLPTLEAQRGRIHAELHAKSWEQKALTWETQHNKVYEQLSKMKGRYEGLNRAFDKASQQARNSEVERDRAVTKYHSQCGLVTDLKHQLDSTTKELDSTTRKYNESLTTNLELTQKLTKTNEDYLELAQAKEIVERKLTQARTNAKRILKIKA
jgi:hypothetical protein